MNKTISFLAIIAGAVYFGTKIGQVMAERGLPPLSEEALRAAWRLVLLDLEALLQWVQAWLRMAS